MNQVPPTIEISEDQEFLKGNVKQKFAAELVITNLAAELVIAAAELVLANKELNFQSDEKEKRAAELFIANKELNFQNDEKEKRAAELVIANKELNFQNDEKEKRAAANSERFFTAYLRVRYWRNHDRNRLAHFCRWSFMGQPSLRL